MISEEWNSTHLQNNKVKTRQFKRLVYKHFMNTNTLVIDRVNRLVAGAHIEKSFFFSLIHLCIHGI